MVPRDVDLEERIQIPGEEVLIVREAHQARVIIQDGLRRRFQDGDD